MGRLKVPKALSDKWEKKLSAEGLAPLTTYSAGEVAHRRLIRKLNAATLDERAGNERYYQRAQKALRRIELAHAVWSLHCEGQGRRQIAAKLSIPEKVTRLVLEKLFDIFDL
jgi:hypothetical protein